VIEMLFRQGLLQQPFSIDYPTNGASWNGLGRRALLVVRIEGAPRQPVRLVWYATRPATLSPYADVAEAFAHHASLAFKVVTERDNSNRAVAARHRVGLAQGILMTRRQLTADQAFALLKRPLPEHPCEATNDRTNGHPDRRSSGLPRRVRPRDTAPTVSQTRPEPAGTLFRCATTPTTTNARPEKACTPPLTAFACVAGSGLQGHLIYDLGIPHDIC
jgi:hypothetical protein